MQEKFENRPQKGEEIFCGLLRIYKLDKWQYCYFSNIQNSSKIAEQFKAIEYSAHWFLVKTKSVHPQP